MKSFRESLDDAFNEKLEDVYEGICGICGQYCCLCLYWCCLCTIILTGYLHFGFEGSNTERIDPLGSLITKITQQDPRQRYPAYPREESKAHFAPRVPFDSFIANTKLNRQNQQVRDYVREMFSEEKKRPFKSNIEQRQQLLNTLRKLRQHNQQELWNESDNNSQEENFISEYAYNKPKDTPTTLAGTLETPETWPLSTDKSVEIGKDQLSFVQLIPNETFDTRSGAGNTTFVQFVNASIQNVKEERTNANQMTEYWFDARPTTWINDNDTQKRYFGELLMISSNVTNVIVGNMSSLLN